METLFQLKKRHKQERIDLFVRAVLESSNVTNAAKMLGGVDRNVIYREIREAGMSHIFPNYKGKSK